MLIFIVFAVVIFLFLTKKFALLISSLLVITGLLLSGILQVH